jgi:probable rRNA maturation factor
MSITIEIDQPFLEKISPDELTQLVTAVFKHQNVEPTAGLSIQISDDERLQHLNLEYLGIDAPTDVLSFPVPFEDPETGCQYYGDIVISYPRAAAQAQTGSHSIVDELKLLVVHGILHLLGYDHAAEDEKTKMWDIQDQLLDALNIKARPTE